MVAHPGRGRVPYLLGEFHLLGWLVLRVRYSLGRSARHHGLSIAFLTIGLIALGRQSESTGSIRWLNWAGVGAAVIGLLTIQPLIFIGLGLVGLATVLDRRGSMGGAALAVGSLLYLAIYATGARLGFEDAPRLSDPQKATAAVALVLVAAGCAIIGIDRLRSVPLSIVPD